MIEILGRRSFGFLLLLSSIFLQFISDSPLWRSRPKGEPTLCNACGLRWRRTCGDLQKYTLKTNITRGNGVKATIGDKSKTPRGSHKSDGDTSSGGSTFSSLNKNTELESGSGHEDSGISPPALLDCHIPRKKRSKLDRFARIPVGMLEGLERKLLHILHLPEFAYLREEQEELLITQNNQISSDEIGLGCILFKSPELDSKNEK